MSTCIVFTNNFKRGLSNKVTFLITAFIPIVVIILGICANYFGQPSFNIGLLNSEQSDVSQKVVQSLKDTKGIQVGFASSSTLQTDLITGKFTAVVDFSGEEGHFTLLSSKNESVTKELEQLINRYMADPVSIIDINSLQETSLGIPQRTMAFIVMVLMLTSTVTASIMIKDKNTGTFTRFLYSPQKVATYIVGNILYNFTISYIQFVIAILMISLFRVDIGIHYYNLLLMGIWVSALATAFGTCIASLFKKEMYANLFSSCIALVLSLIGGTFVAVDRMPTLLTYISAISPTRWVIEATTYMEIGHLWFSTPKYISILTLFILIFAINAIISNKNGARK